MPFLPATGVEKEGARKGNLWQRRVGEGCFYIKITMMIKGDKILPGKTLHGRPIIDFTGIDPRDLFAVIRIPENKSFSVSHTALEKLDFEESIKRK